MLKCVILICINIKKRKINKKVCGFLTCEMKKGVIIYNFKFFKL